MYPGVPVLVTLIAITTTTLVRCVLGERIPEGFTYPWRLRLFLAVIRISLAIGRMLERMRLLSLVDVTNFVLKLIARVKPEPSKCRIQKATFDGVKVRLYSPKSVAETDGGTYPGLAFFHGGGWSIGNTGIYDDFILPIMNIVDVVVVSVEYRLAPRFKFPIPLEDCVTATKYFLGHAAEFKVDPERVALCGDSAGGNMAAAVALKLRDENFRPMPKLQVLVYPVLQSVDFSLPSMIQNASGPLLTTYWLSYYTSLYASGSLRYASAIRRNRHVDESTRRRLYANQLNHDLLDARYRQPPYRKPDLSGRDPAVWRHLKHVLLDPYFSPLLCDNLSGLPVTLIYNAHYDVLRDEGCLYARRLQTFGIPVTHIVDEHALHGMCSFRHLFPKESYDALNHIANFLKAKL